MSPVASTIRNNLEGIRNEIEQFLRDAKHAGCDDPESLNDRIKTLLESYFPGDPLEQADVLYNTVYLETQAVSGTSRHVFVSDEKIRNNLLSFEQLCDATNVMVEMLDAVCFAPDCPELVLDFNLPRKDNVEHRGKMLVESANIMANLVRSGDEVLGGIDFNFKKITPTLA